MQHEQPSLDRRLSGIGKALVSVVTLALLGAAAWFAFAGISARQAETEEQRKIAQRRAIATVDAAPPVLAKNSASLDLPGRLEPFARAELYARVSGYVQSWNSDIGAVVKAGDVLAEIDAPELDQQLFQAQSDLTNAKVNAELANTTNQRYQSLTPGSSVSRQTIDEKAADLAAKRALVKSNEANVERLLAMKQYKKVVAPFDGMITVRNTDVGQLINAASQTGSPMFVVSQTQKLRLFISVPQSVAPQVKVGMPARVTVPERPGKSYDARVEAMSGAIDATSGTSRYQLIVANASGELLAGAYAFVSLNLESPSPVYTIPSSALIFDKNGLSVATVDEDNKVKIKPVSVARDLGKVIELRDGLTESDLVIDSPPDAVVDGDEVRIKSTKDSAPAAPATAAPSTTPAPAVPSRDDATTGKKPS